MAVDEKKLTNGRRSKLGRRTPASDPNLSSLFSPKKTDYPPGFTVDDLWLYRRKKTACESVEDNIKLPEGSFKLLKSEYTKKYRDYYSTSDLSKEVYPIRSLKPESSIKLEGLHEHHSEYNDSYTPYPYEKARRIVKPSHELITADEMENNVNVESPAGIFELSRKPKSSLQLEGDLEFLTEHAEKFIEYLLSDRPHLLRTPTTLQLFGEMEKKTETSEQFKPYDLERRPPLCKKFTNLHLEGDMNIITEKQESFKTYQMPDRPVIRKKPTNLHLEGALTWKPEYRSEYVDHKIMERTKLVLPANNLKPDGSYENIPETKSPFVNTIHPVIPHLRESVNSPCPSRPPSGMMGERRGTLRSQLSRSHQSLLFDLNKNVYVAEVERCRTPVKGRRAAQPEERVKTPTRSHYRDYVSPERVKPVRRPHDMFSSDGELDYYTRKNETSSRSPSPKHKSELCISEPKYNSDGRFICQPEYRRAYVDYLIRERIDRKPRTIDFLNQNKARVFDGNGTTDDSNERQITTTSSSDFVPTTCKNKKPSSASSNSLEVVKTDTKKMKIRSYSQIEEEAFGPRLPIPPRRGTSSSSRSSSPRPPSTRRRTTPQNNKNCHSFDSQTSFESEVSQSKYKKFAPVRVENIACKQASVPPSRSAASPIRSKWMREDSTQSEPTAAFYILEDNRTGSSAKPRSYTDSNLNRVDKFVTPSWYRQSK